VIEALADMRERSLHHLYLRSVPLTPCDDLFDLFCSFAYRDELIVLILVAKMKITLFVGIEVKVEITEPESQAGVEADQ